MLRFTAVLVLALAPLAPAADPPKLSEFTHAIAFSSDGKLFAAVQSTDRVKRSPATVVIFDAKTWERGRVIDGPKAELRMVAFVPETTHVAVAASDGMVHIWDAATGKAVRTIDTKRPWITAMAVSPGSKRLAVVHQFQSTLSIWDLTTGERRHELPSKDVIFQRSGPLTFTPDGKRLVVAHMGPAHLGQFNGVREWDVETGEEAARYKSPAGGLLSAAVSPDGKWLAAGMRAGSLSDEEEKRRGDLYVWDRTTGKLVHTLNGGTPDMVTFLAFCPDSTKLYTATKGRASTVRPNGSSQSSQVHAWDVKAGKRLWVAEGPGAGPLGLAVAPDRKSVGLLDGEGAWFVNGETGKQSGAVRVSGELK